MASWQKDHDHREWLVDAKLVCRRFRDVEKANGMKWCLEAGGCRFQNNPGQEQHSDWL